MQAISIILIIFTIVAIGTLLYAITYNKLQHYKTRIEVSENSIDDALRQKYDYICELNSLIKKEITDKDYLKEFIELKNHKLTNYDTDRKLIEAINIIKELKNDHSNIDNKEYDKIMNNVKKLDIELIAAKSFFNKYTSELNIIIRKFPTNVVAKNHKFKIKPFFDNKNMQDAVIDDFKL